MDNLKLKEDVEALKNFGEHLENMLKLVGFDVCDLPDDVLVLLDKSVEIQAQGHLPNINLSCLREFYFTKKREKIENQIVLAQQLAALKKQNITLEKMGKEIAALERFRETVDNRLTPVDDLYRNIIQIDGKIKALLERQKGLKIPDDFNIESVIEKIDMLEQRK